MAKKNKHDKKKKKKDLMHVEAAEQRDIQTTHGLITRSINMMLAKGIEDTRKKGGDANIDINNKAVELGMRWCSWNGQKARDKGVEEIADNVSEIDRIREEQREKVVHLKERIG